MRFLPLVFALSALFVLPQAAQADPVTTALNDAVAAFAKARPQMGREAFGVDVAAYGDALTAGRFASAYWGGEIALDLHQSRDAGGSCGRFAAYVQLPPQDGTIRMVVCPQFSADGTAALRRLTVLHEMVHVVAGPDECRAMAFAARVEAAATGAFTPVDRYWQANNCPASAFSLP
ncbi:hypothetical protein SAMN06295905_3021 [Devosia lucknowensis]|uniref:Lysine-specific metallo-endopeptidase n=1 Tax=Devosia lucknowensis TaxID=1096929 RepID=A0A1Y6G6C0_9HYPH|nr:hypothetical protein [Devosia lucknowensis]SMQ85731.1 hypothetical protein SAMN06295905_3021 [Devosia lucknowensis]